ncbi:hypothetical protein [Desulfoferrobacter suflitae]|uniref:hypothetical protein n=1 Tax=Desulfoferrobacter suflitae TaxID=2865782 RepID=UPI0021648EBE|nr:hypothetical protein [Desulfoferrobacter suflitae]MCK8602648.1 hypothetical protein [Desulfoferrobacter suflitae]
MADVIEFGKKAQGLRALQDNSVRQRKIEALRKIFQCTRCMLKCAKCGIQLESEKQDNIRYASPYPFCLNCQEEYEEYRERVENNEKTPRYYWHNDAWMKVWEMWLEHQKLLDEYRKSKEFLQLLEEVEELMKK